MRKKRLLISISAVAILCSSLQAQSTNPSTPSGGQPTQSGNSANNQTAGNPKGTPNQSSAGNAQSSPATTPPAPSKAQPQAKSQEEFHAYQAAVAKPDASAAEAAANDFAKKYPTSELLVALYSMLMQKYQNAGNGDKVLDMGHNILRIDSENIPALALTAYVLSETTRDTDLDRDQKYAEGAKNAQQVIKTIDSALVVPPNVAPEQLAGLKSFLLSMANSALGYIEMNQKAYPASEQHFKAAIEANKGYDADAMAYLRLAIVQDNQKKYPEASANAAQAMQLAEAQKNVQIVSMAKSEKDRLSKLTPGTAQEPKQIPPKQ